MPPPLRLPLPPWAPIACSRQERTGLSERQRSARTTGSLAELADLGLPSHDCTVGTALAFCVYVTNEVDRDASMLQAHTVHIHAQAHDVHTHAHTHSHTHTQTHTQTNTNTHIHKHTHTHMHMRTHTYTGAHTHIHTNTNTHKHTHTRTHNLSL